MGKLKVAVAAILASVLLVFSVAGSAQAVSVDAGSSRLLFNNTVKIGVNAGPGFSTRYSGVVAGVDALVTVTSVTRTTVSNVDRVSSVDNWQLWTNLNIAGGNSGEVTYRVDFVSAGTNTPVILQNMAINVGDIDAQQYVKFAGVQSYTLGANSQLTVTNNAGAYKFAGPAAGSTDTDTRFWAQVNYAAISTVDITLGAAIGGAALFQVAFGAADWAGTSVPPVQPTPVPFTVTYNANAPGSSLTGAAPAATTQNTGVAHTIPGNTGSMVYAYPVNGNANAVATFLGWGTEFDGSGVFYAAGSTIIPSQNMTLYAIWDLPAAVTLTYHANDATGGTIPAPTSHDGTVTVAGPGTLERTGYKFVRWTTCDAQGVITPNSTASYEVGEVLSMTANADVCAVWEALPVVPPESPVDINANPGDPIGGAEVPYVVPGLEPGTDWSLVVDPTGTGDTEELDAGQVDGSGTVSGIGEMPETLPPGEYELIFNGFDANGDPMTIEKKFVVGPTGLLVSEDVAAIRAKTVLANTGIAASGLLFVAGITIAFGVVLMTRRRSRTAL